jgi:tRNA pseudouridine65 synthase
MTGQSEPLPPLYRDPYLVAVSKPAGLLVHRSDLDRHERRWALQVVRDQIGLRVYAVHRLDRGTSGVLLFGLTPDIARSLGAQFEQQRVRKTYLAVVRGHPPEAGVIHHPLARDPEAPVGERGPLAAETRFRRLATVELPHRVDRYPTSRYALLEIEPRTGRRHQIRRHLKHAAHPIIGDTTYGKGGHNRLFGALFGCRRLLLACVELRLAHPLTGDPLAISAPLDPDYTRVLSACGWSGALPSRWIGTDAAL